MLKTTFALNIKILRHLCYRIGVPLDTLKYFIAKKQNNVHELRLVQIKNGRRKERTVYNPSKDYNKILRHINANLFRKAVLPDGVLGGIVGKSINDMASAHCGKEFVFSIDMEDFYPSISSGRVFKFFRNAGCTNEVSEKLTDLVTLNDSLPQGYPTSPMLANLIAMNLDLQHLEISQKYKLTRTRWIDDIVFSGTTKNLQQAIPGIIGAIKPHGFKINRKKTDAKHRAEIPKVVGLNVNKDEPRVPQVVVDRVRFLLIECIESGVNAVQAAYEPDCFGKPKNLKTALAGKITFIGSYNPNEGQELKELFDSVSWNNGELQN